MGWWVVVADLRNARNTWCFDHFFLLVNVSGVRIEDTLTMESGLFGLVAINGHMVESGASVELRWNQA